MNLEHMEWQVPEGAYQSATLSGGAWRLPYPDYIGYSHREYGHRVGHLPGAEDPGEVRRSRHHSNGLPHCPTLPLPGRLLQRAGCEFIGHGVSVSRMITSRMSEAEEREYIREAIDTLAAATGSTPAGWLGPEYGESTRTPQLLAEAGLRYVCDWTNDEQPYPLKTPRGEAYALPVMLELDDVNALWDRKVVVARYRDMLQSLRRHVRRRGRQRTPPRPQPAPLADRPALPHPIPGRGPGAHHQAAGRLGRHRLAGRRLVPGPQARGLAAPPSPGCWAIGLAPLPGRPPPVPRARPPTGPAPALPGPP